MQWTSVQRLQIADEVEQVLRQGMDDSLWVLSMDIVSLIERLTMEREDAPLMQTHTTAAAEVLREVVRGDSAKQIELQIWHATAEPLIRLRGSLDAWEPPVLERADDYTIYTFSTEDL